MLRSALAEQLESLVFANCVLYPEDKAAVQMALDPGALPRLRRFGFRIGHPIREQDVQMVKRIIEAASVLEELELTAKGNNYGKFLDLIKRAPNLRKLTLATLIDIEEHTGKKLGWKEFVLEIADLNPQLRVVRNSHGREGSTEWEIIRREAGVEVICVE